MLLDEWKKELDSEARRKAARLDKENKHMKITLKKQQERIERTEAQLLLMYRRCAKDSTAEKCRKCAMRDKCEKMLEGGAENGKAERIRKDGTSGGKEEACG